MIIVPGSINLDLIAQSNGLPTPGQTITGTSYKTAPGGKGANQALAAQRAGGNVRMVGAVGGDPNAGLALALLEEANVDLRSVRTIEQRDIATGVALIVVDSQSGENQIVVVPGANGMVEVADVADLAVTNEDLLVLQQEIPSDVVEAALNLANAKGATSLLNIAPFNQTSVELTLLASVTVANETEFDELAAAMNLQGQDRIERAQDFCQRSGKTMVVTLGKDGVFAVAESSIFHAPSLPIVPVDTVGAGDTFCGCLAVALSERKSLQQALNFAAAAGSLACLKEGAQPSIPIRSDIDSALNES